MVKSIRKLLGAALVLCLSFFGISAAMATPTTSSVTILGGVIDEQHPLGSEDPYTETSTDNGATWQPAYLVGVHPWGLVEGTNSWLNCGNTLEQCLLQTSLYRYRFFVPTGFTNATLDAAFIVDNNGEMTLNGQPFSPGYIAQNWSSEGPVDVQSKLVAGWNELLVTLQDQGGLAGINYRLTISLTAEDEIILAQPGGAPLQLLYNALGGEVSRTSDSYVIGDPALVLPTPSKLGHLFLGWFTEETAGTQVADTYTPSSDKTLYARWAAVRSLETERTLANSGFDSFGLTLLALALIGAGSTMSVAGRLKARK